ncbi:MAG: F0F1 ATP synthase subunit A [Candidatus Caenarcaniphilales bacterium]|nr:F0F1 ATP synthase subunit A [Candidatus Caenarcaniphilales bacterium]
MSGASGNHIQRELVESSHLVVNWDTIVECWVLMAFLLILTWLGTRALKKQSIGKAQFILESIYDVWHSQVVGQISWKALMFLPLVGGIFLFALFGYWHGLLPWKIFALFSWWPHLDNGHPFEGSAPTSDINVTAGMAIVSVIAYLYAGTASSKFTYWAPYLGLSWHHGKLELNITGLIEWLDLVLRPLTLSLRLFANTFAGEALLVEIVKMTYVLAPLPILAFEFGIGIIQAFIFAMLTTVYISIATSHGDHPEEHSEETHHENTFSEQQLSPAH